MKSNGIIAMFFVLIFVAIIFTYTKNNGAIEKSQGITVGEEKEGQLEARATSTKILENKEVIKKGTTMQEVETKKVTGAILKTNFGDIEIAFNEHNAPQTVAYFVAHAGTHVYDGVRFHRVIKGFMIQTGDPQSKDVALKNVWGRGGTGVTFNDELRGNEKYDQGIVAMANSGPNTNDSQFFIVTASPNVPLPPSYTIFAKVVKGLDVALAIEKVKTELPRQLDRPYEDVIVKEVILK